MTVLLLAAAAISVVTPAHAEEMVDGAQLPWPLALPFAGILMSIALGPLVVKEWWHIHYEKAAAFWSALSLAGLVLVIGWPATLGAFVHSMALEYVPFILMLFALFTAAGGISISGKLAGTPFVNVTILGFGALIASWIGTTGASMILIRPLIRANAGRRFNAHVVVFFIFIVANIGGALTPLGDPPLFLGFLHGVEFFWTMRTLWPHTLFAVWILLLVFLALDSLLFLREKRSTETQADDGNLRIRGLVNLALIGVVILAIVTSGIWHPGIAFDLFGTRLELQNILREAVMVGVGLASLALTHDDNRARNGFDWEPIKEVAYLFAAIFTCIIPVMSMLQAGKDGPFASILALLTNDDGTPNTIAYFWATGLLSSFLDNAPTYLVFFELASGDPAELMTTLGPTLTAISLGAVFMGANTYIGNAPNFMVYAIARRSGVNMPGFFPYMLWSSAILLPLFVAITWLFLVPPSVGPRAGAEAPPVEAPPVEAPPDEAAPVEVPPVEAQPVEAAPVEAQPAEAAPVEAPPVEAQPVEAQPVEAPETPSKVKIYTVKPGDSLWTIAEAAYGPGQGGKYRLIIEANKELLSGKSTIRPGQALRIPPLQE
jgi:Na+/H+ antiporter NhaD/arsenite permease-like protein